MNRYGQVFEDPSYDEDGVLADDEQDWQDVEYDEDFDIAEDLSPFITVNS